jgi:TusA-related sulfurtransferase
LKIDCKDLPCPEPVLKTKEAWDKLENNDFLDIELNSYSSIENVKRFAKKEKIFLKETLKTKKLTVLTLVNGYECELANDTVGKPIYTLIVGSLISAVLASSCCLAPFLFLLFGVSVSSLTFLQVLAPYHIYFSLFSLLVLAYLWQDYFRYKKHKLFCDTWLSKNYKTLLIVGTVFVLILTTYPYWIGYILE